MRAEARDTKRLPSFPQVTDDQVLGQQPSEAPPVFRDHLHAAKAECQIVFLLLLLLLFLCCISAFVWLFAPTLQGTAYESIIYVQRLVILLILLLKKNALSDFFYDVGYL